MSLAIKYFSRWESTNKTKQADKKLLINSQRRTKKSRNEIGQMKSKNSLGVFMLYSSFVFKKIPLS